MVARAQDTEQTVEVDQMVKDLQEKVGSRSKDSSAALYAVITG